MVADGCFDAFLLWGLLWLYVLLTWAWSRARLLPGLPPPTPISPPRQRSGDPKPFPGLTSKPHWAAWAQAAQEPAISPLAPPPPPLISRRGCPRQVDASTQCCPHAHCAYSGRVGCGNLQANGHPSSGPWRQWHCTACQGYFLETHGTP
jgi:hypothetical protein